MDETRTLAEFAVNFRYEDCPPEVIHQAKRCTVETIGCALGAVRTPLVEAALRTLQRFGADGGGPAQARRAATDVSSRSSAT